jgi:hypothetical protein
LSPGCSTPWQLPQQLGLQQLHRSPCSATSAAANARQLLMLPLLLLLLLVVVVVVVGLGEMAARG